MVSAIVVVDRSLETVETVTATVPISFPYVPGLLSYREAPGIAASLRELDTRPDVLLVNGCGINHFQGVGLASHVGVKEDIPTIGVTRRLLCGRFSTDGKEGPWPIHYKDRIVGNAVASRKGSRPVFVALGHLMDLKRSLEMTLPLFTGTRLPLPLAEAHRVCTLKKKSL
ncbi:MAG: endonuclease V [Candidatus Undinarchaeales archaeon]|nr:endonuclease V [Candidatus Undinarchaeales archaeon]